MLARTLARIARVVAGSSAQWHCEPSAARQRIYIANHSSHLDFVVIWAHLPDEVRARTRPVAARDYWSGPLRRQLAQRVFRAVLVDRGGSGGGESAVNSMATAVAEPGSIILFPEGTRSTTDTVQQFRSGLYYLCKQLPGTEVVPVYLGNLNRILPKGTGVPIPLLSRVVFGEPLTLDDVESKEAFLARCRDAVEQLR